MLRRGCFALLCLVVLATPLALTAQITPSIEETTLTFSPETPAPGETFTARVEAYSYDMSRTAIRWSIDGVGRPEFNDREAVELVAPALGRPLVVRVAVTEQDGGVHTASRRSAPSTVELIVEGATRVPHFYRGRALPSKGSGVRVVAMPSLYAPSGGLYDPDSLVYTWRVGSQVAQRGVGANTLETVMPDSRALTITISVETLDGTARHATGARIDPAEPIVRFYEDNPLYGLSRAALPEEFTLLAPEISVRAEPYFTSRDLLANAAIEWTLDGVPVENPNTDRTTLTLRNVGGAGSSHIGFSARNLSALLQAARGALVVYFTE